jgi:hypothetical protein
MFKVNQRRRQAGINVAIFCMALVLPGCKPEANMPMLDQTVTAPQDGAFAGNRFKVERVGVFKDNLSYDGRRGVYIITDTKTGQELVGLSGIGISELGSHKSGKATIRDER